MFGYHPGNSLYKKGLACYNAGQHKEAVEYWKEAANVGHVEAQFLLGKCYSSGTGVTEDEELAMTWIEKAAQQGLADAQYELGKMHEDVMSVISLAIMEATGSDEDNDDFVDKMNEEWDRLCEIALKWYRAAAAQNHVPAKKASKELENIIIDSLF